ncbi:carboxylate--amine ligase [Halobaculum gomorrense]|uniref:Predicted ATP-dependent carboligase, ATP-grasp superfamily n=1 Tax=Halobaculum gomorrense TaxID=43928 RepID=A0A1M5MD20_9EURY|nr:carboxylate--amine ligase [Halobaculum gomorrense]SHG75126.1 Predicted ATP-dependent carboligase, ATP-grasp superfamily [Halobaculum gomorrense]
MADTTPERDRALIPTGHDASSYTCVRSLARQGVGTVVASEKATAPAAASRYCDEAVSLPPPREGLLAYRDALLALAEREDVRTVIPVRPEDSYLLSRYEDAFAEHVSLVVPSMSQLERVYDRLQLAAAAEAAGVPVPETRLLSEVDDWTPELLVKSRYNVLADSYLSQWGPDDIDVVKHIHHVGRGETPDAEEIRTAMRHDPIIQEFVRTDGEFMFTGLYDRGEPLATFQHRQIRGNSYTDGGGVYRRSIRDPELERVGRALLSELDWYGLACIEYMRDAETGEYVLTEINPRMWQSLPSTVHAGADYPWYYWLAATGRADEIDDDYQIGVGTHMLHGEVGYLTSVFTEESPHVARPSIPRTLWEIGSSIAREPRFDYLRLDDPGPFLAGMRNALPTGAIPAMTLPGPVGDRTRRGNR